MARNPHDRFFRIAFGHAGDAAAWLKQVLPPIISRDLSWEDLVLVSGDLPDEGTGATRGDLVFRTTLRGQPILVVILFEHQRCGDRLMTVRMASYSLQQLRAWRREHPESEELPIVFAIVLHQGPGAYTAPLDLRDAVPLPDDLRSDFGPYLLGQRTIVLDLTRQPELLGHRSQIGPSGAVIARFPARKEEGACRRT